MKTAVFRYVVIAIVVLLAGALAGFYFYLRGAQGAATQTDDARGLGTAAPSFQGGIGSTYQNIISALTGGGGGPEQPSGGAAPRLWNVSATPVAGFGWESSTTLRFIERATGYVFSADIATRGVERISGALMPKMYEAYLAPGGYVIMRGIDDRGSITTFSGTVVLATSTAATSSPGSLHGLSLTPNITALAPVESARTIFYTVKDGQGTSVFSANWDGAAAKRLYTSSIGGWRIFSTPGGVILSQHASDDTLGYAYKLDTKGALESLVSGPGLSVAPHPSAPAAYLYSLSGGGALSLWAKTSASTTPVRLSVKTVTEKCAWLRGPSLVAYCAVPVAVSSPRFVDEWYRGTVHTNDEWWQVNASGAAAQMIYAPASDSLSVDVERPVVDPSGNYIAFRDASNQSLWVLKIAQ